MAASRDSLFVTGSEDEASLAIMTAMAEKPLEEPYSLSAVPLIFENSEWRDWVPPDGHSLLVEFGPSHMMVTGAHWKTEVPWTRYKGFSEHDTFFTCTSPSTDSHR